MPKYRATTESGRVYVINTSDDHWHTEPDSGYGGPIRKFSVGDRRDLEWLVDVWDWPPAIQPEVGKSMFLATSPGNWRLSTDVVKVEVL